MGEAVDGTIIIGAMALLAYMAYGFTGTLCNGIPHNELILQRFD